MSARTRGASRAHAVLSSTVRILRRRARSALDTLGLNCAALEQGRTAGLQQKPHEMQDEWLRAKVRVLD